MRSRIGDIFEIKTRLGLAYAQITHRIPSWGQLIRVIDGFFPSRPFDLEDLAMYETRFVTFFPADAALSRGIFERVGNASMPSPDQRFPVFKSGIPAQDTRRVGDNWWLWDGKIERRVGRLRSDQKRFPIRQIINDTMLIHRIESGWLPEHEE